MGRAAAVLAVVAALAAYDSLHARLWNASTWWDVAFIALVLMPLSFAIVWLLLPWRQARGLLPLGLAFAVLTVAFHIAKWHTPENLVKFVAVALIGFWFLGYFETASWVVLVALIIPWVDAFSVFSHHGPTHKIVTGHPYVFTVLSYAFPIPGENSSANLGLPDLLFFALFLAASARFALRPRLTWIALTASFGATIAIAVALRLAGLPALPLLSLAFLGANADLLWERVRPSSHAALSSERD